MQVRATRFDDAVERRFEIKSHTRRAIGSADHAFKKIKTRWTQINDAGPPERS
jgi:hypothetical protein